MKKLIIFIFILSFLNSKACDICGCAINLNGINGVLPLFNKNIVGLKSNYQSFKHPQTIENKTINGYVLQDQYYTQELMMRLYLKPKIQLYFSLPFKQNIRKETSTTYSINGIGDINLGFNYALVNQSDSLKNNVWMWWTGAGIKLPNGKYQQRNKEKTMLPVGFQIGTGAYSGFFTNQMTYRFKKMGLNWLSNYSINGENELFYQLGNSFQTQIQAFYWINLNPKSKILPQFGVSYLNFDKDKNYSIIKQHSGGQRLNILGSLDFFTNGYLFSAQYQTVITEQRTFSMPITQPVFSLSFSKFF